MMDPIARYYGLKKDQVIVPNDFIHILIFTRACIYRL
jgi:hypothetical protein